MTVRSKLLYPSEIMTPSNNLLNKLNVIQNDALCSILGTCRKANSSFINIITGISPMPSIWYINRLKYYYKLIKNELNNELPGNILKCEIKYTTDECNYPII